MSVYYIYSMAEHRAIFPIEKDMCEVNMAEKIIKLITGRYSVLFFLKEISGCCEMSGKQELRG